MRIALVTDAFHPAVDEATITVRHLADEFIDRGHEVLLVAAAPGITRYRNCRVVRVRAWDPVGAQARTALADFRADVVIVGDPATIGSKALKHAQRLGMPTATVEHRAPVEFLTETWLTSRRTDLLFPVSNWQRDQLVAAGHHCSVWAPGVDVDTFTPTARDPHLHARWARSHGKHGPLLVVGYVGPLRKREGVRRLRALETLPAVRPVVIGEGKQRDWLRERLRRVTFLPELASVELATAIASLDVLVHPGEHVTSGHALRFAAASGVPAVATHAASSVVRHLETGLLFEPDRDDFADVVASLASARTRTELGRHGRRLAERRTWSQAATELLDRITSLLGTRHAA